MLASVAYRTSTNFTRRRHRAYCRRYQASDKGKATKRAWHQSLAGQESWERYTYSPKGREAKHRASLKYHATAASVADASRRHAITRARRYGFRGSVIPADYDAAPMVEQAKYMLQLRESEPRIERILHHVINLRDGGIHAEGFVEIVTRAEHGDITRVENADRMWYEARVHADRLESRRDRAAWGRAWIACMS